MSTFAGTLLCTFLRADHGGSFVVQNQNKWAFHIWNRNQTSNECSFANDLCALMSGSSFTAGIHRFLRKSTETLSILTVPNLKIHKNTKIPFGKVLRGKNSPKKDGQRGRGFIWTRLWTQTYFRSSLVTFRWSDSKARRRPEIRQASHADASSLGFVMSSQRLGGVPQKWYTRTLHPEVRLLNYPFIYRFWQKSSPIVYLLLINDTPFTHQV